MSKPFATPSNSSGSSGTSSAPPATARFEWRTNLWLFLATVVSVFVTGAAGDRAPFFSPEALIHGAQFTGALLSILLAHEFGHYIAARIHKVDATLPFFIPLPLLSPFGTMGAVIRMRGAIPTRKALLDIGAAGPLAGLALAIPMYVWGVAHSSPVVPGADPDVTYVELGESLLTRALDALAAPNVPAGMELDLSPVAFAAWAGMFVTMINLLPVGQLDAGHVAYALFGPRQNRFAGVVHRAVLVFFFVSLVSFIVRDLRVGFGLVRIGQHVGNALFWLVWFEVLAVLGALGSPKRDAELADGHTLSPRTRLVAVVGLATLAALGRDEPSPLLWGAWFAGLAVLLVMEARWGVLKPNDLLDHPSTGPEPLGRGRAAVAVLTLVLFVLLFMPTPIGL